RRWPSPLRLRGRGGHGRSARPSARCRRMCSAPGHPRSRSCPVALPPTDPGRTRGSRSSRGPCPPIPGFSRRSAWSAWVRRRRGRRLLPELSEVHRTLLDERVAALQRLLGLVVEVEGGAGELGHAGSLLGVDVERLLGEGEGGGTLLQELGAPFLPLRSPALSG